MAKRYIHINEISKSFGIRRILDGCSIEINAGSVFGLVGRNGSGKTTLIRIVLGLLKQDAGNVTVLDCIPWQHEESLYGRVGVVLENDGFSPNMTVRENLAFFAGAKNKTWPEVEAYLNEFWKETFIYDEVHHGRRTVKFLSRGQKMQCGICRAFLGRPDILVLDEPTVALDVDAYDHVCGLIRYARQRGAAVLISSHQLSAIEELCDVVGVLHNKHLQIVSMQASGSDGQEWIIVADNVPAYGTIIEQYTGTGPAYRDNAWHIIVSMPDTDVPELLRLLINAGCGIREVKPIPIPLKEHLRAYYEKN